MNKVLARHFSYGVSAFAAAGILGLTGADVFATTGVNLDPAEHDAFACDNHYVFGTDQKDATITVASSTSDCSIFVGSDAGAVTLDLGGNSITTTTAYPTIEIEKGASLTLTNGTLTNLATSKPVIYNNGDFTLNGATLTKNGGAYYVILNHGNTVVNSGTVINSVINASLVDNGYSSYNSTNEYAGYAAGKGIANPTMTIYGGTFDGGMNTIKNDDGGVLTIEGGLFRNNYQVAVMNWHHAVIDGGTFEVPTGGDKTTLFVGHYDGGVNEGYLEVNGGVYKADYLVESMIDSDKVYEDVVIKINDGDFRQISKSVINTSVPEPRPDLSGNMAITGGTFAASGEEPSSDSEEGVADESAENNNYAASVISANLAEILSGTYKGFVPAAGANLTDLLLKTTSAKITTSEVSEDTTDPAKQAEIEKLNESLVDNQFSYSLFDIDAAVFAGGEKIGNLISVPEPMIFRLPLTAKLKEEAKNADADGYDVIITVLRAHTDTDGTITTDVVAVVENPEGEDIGFAASDFSTFMLTAFYIERETPTPEPEVDPTPESEGESILIPDTGHGSSFGGNTDSSSFDNSAASEKNKAPFIALGIAGVAVYIVLMKKIRRLYFRHN